MSADKSDADREAKLAQALRANLRRRKAPKPVPKAGDSGPATGGEGGESGGR
ncbi:hypothetical protein ACFODL_07225 [Phenylobacterium terrae]|uniref:Uncharacterized protein n=1 Tax=Phenylobacterium terrae TaxID=2665495 RepID=A0ABW4N6F8_9CAUL